MLGLQYACIVSNTSFTELAKELGITKQAVDSWFSHKSKIPIKYLPILENKFGLCQEYYQKEIDDNDKIIILKNEIKKLENNQNKYMKVI